jgi:hypothetical protein
MDDVAARSAQAADDDVIAKVFGPGNPYVMTQVGYKKL